MSFISNIIDRRRVWKALPDYPVYSPPFHDGEAVLSKNEIAANYEYFLTQKALRLEYLAGYLRQFSIELRLAKEVLPDLDGWLYRYGGHLIPIGGEVISAIHDYEPAWVREYHGLNVVHDIAIFAGDYIISNNSSVRWDAYYGDGGRRDYEKSGFGQPCLIGMPHPDYQNRHCAIFEDEVCACCISGRSRLKHRSKSVVTDWDIAGRFARRLDELADPNPLPPRTYHQIVMEEDDRSRSERRS